MNFGPQSAYSMVMAATAGSATVDLGTSWESVYLLVPTMASAANLDVYVKASSGEDYYQLGKDIPNTTTVQSWSFTIAASAAASGRVVPLPAGFQYYKVVADSVPTSALNFKVICGSD